jgi:bifunctional non-homologous end joining protein LigD
MRQPIFAGLREDKEPREVQRERPVPVTAAQSAATRHLQNQNVGQSGDQIINIDGHKVSITNQDKLYWPDSGITKGDMVSYYHRDGALYRPVPD